MQPAANELLGYRGSVPQVLAANVAAAIGAGDLDLGLIVGAEALATVRRLKKAGEKPQWLYKPAERRPFRWICNFTRPRSPTPSSKRS